MYVDPQLSQIDPQAAGAALAAGATVFGGLVITILIATIISGVLPGIIASARKHPQQLQIWLITILLGWTFVGWVIALIKALGPIDQK